jgi:hypothetical protein
LCTATDNTFLADSCPITYSSSASLISCGFGTREAGALASSWPYSSAMMSLQSSMHSSQM